MLLTLVKRRGKKMKEERKMVRLETTAVCIQVLGIFENSSIDSILLLNSECYLM